VTTAAALPVPLAGGGATLPPAPLLVTGPLGDAPLGDMVALPPTEDVPPTEPLFGAVPCVESAPQPATPRATAAIDNARPSTKHLRSDIGSVLPSSHQGRRYQLPECVE
jgi:hypothetical protein